MDSIFPALLCRPESGRGLPHSKTWRKFWRLHTSRSVVECGSPPPLSTCNLQPATCNLLLVCALVCLVAFQPGCAPPIGVNKASPARTHAQTHQSPIAHG